MSRLERPTHQESLTRCPCPALVEPGRTGLLAVPQALDVR